MRILKDRWVPKKGTQLVHDGDNFTDKDMLISDFIDDDLKCWEQESIMHCFNQLEVPTILSIILPWNQFEDKLIWEAKKDGDYSIKSVYHHLRENKVADSTGPSHSHQLFLGLWKRFWSTPVHNRIKNFIWRLAN